jgi:hypothetical protein
MAEEIDDVRSAQQTSPAAPMLTIVNALSDLKFQAALCMWLLPEQGPHGSDPTLVTTLNVSEIIILREVATGGAVYNTRQHLDLFLYKLANSHCRRHPFPFLMYNATFV